MRHEDCGELSYWRLASGIEVDFVVSDMQVAIEAKSSERITRDHLQGLRSLMDDHPRVRRRIVVCREPRARKTDDGLEVLPAATFVRRPRAGELTQAQRIGIPRGLLMSAQSTSGRATSSPSEARARGSARGRQYRASEMRYGVAALAFVLLAGSALAQSVPEVCVP